MNEADAVVLIVSHLSHGAYWRARDEALERGIPVVVTSATNPQRILDAVRGKIQP